MPVIATVRIATVIGEPLVAVADDGDAYVSLTLRDQHIGLTRQEAFRVADALRACALTAIDEQFGRGELGGGGLPRA